MVIPPRSEAAKTQGFVVRAKNSPPDCFLNALTVLEEIITYLGLFRYKQHSLFSGCCVFSPRVILSLSNFSVEDPVCTLFDAASQFGSALLRSG